MTVYQKYISNAVGQNSYLCHFSNIGSPKDFFQALNLYFLFIAANNESGKTKPTLHIHVTRSYNIHKEKPNNFLLNF